VKRIKRKYQRNKENIDKEKKPTKLVGFFHFKIIFLFRINDISLCLIKK